MKVPELLVKVIFGSVPCGDYRDEDFGIGQKIKNNEDLSTEEYDRLWDIFYQFVQSAKRKE